MMHNITLNQGFVGGQTMATNAPLRVVDHETEFLYEKLIILLHSYRCLKLEQSGKPKLCTLPHCREMKNILEHMEGCNEGKRCTAIDCAASRQIILHWRTCYKLQCDTCFPLLETENQPPPLSTPVNPHAITDIQPLRLTVGPKCGGADYSGIQMPSSQDPSGVPVHLSMASQCGVPIPSWDSYGVTTHMPLANPCNAPMPLSMGSPFGVAASLSYMNPHGSPILSYGESTPSPHDPCDITIQSPFTNPYGVPTPSSSEDLYAVPSPLSNSWDKEQQGRRVQPKGNFANASVAIKRKAHEESAIGYSSPFTSNQWQPHGM